MTVTAQVSVLPTCLSLFSLQSSSWTLVQGRAWASQSAPHLPRGSLGSEGRSCCIWTSAEPVLPPNTLALHTGTACSTGECVWETWPHCPNGGSLFRTLTTPGSHRC